MLVVEGTHLIEVNMENATWTPRAILLQSQDSELYCAAKRKKLPNEHILYFRMNVLSTSLWIEQGI